jgi:Protein of unknown function (DUF1566)
MIKKTLFNSFQYPYYCISLFTSVIASNYALAGNLDSPAAVTDVNSAMYSLNDIYNRLNTGSAGSKRTTSFSEPATGPSATGYNLNDVMGASPTVDDTNGATATEVISGKTYWGIKSGGDWGLKTGTLATQTLNPASNTLAAGNYTGTTLSTVDSDLATGNIKSGVTIFGVSGKTEVVDTTTGDALASDILSGKKAWVDGSEITGSATAGSNVSGAGGSKTFTIPDGHYTGSKTATANDTDLVTGNIKSGVTILGVSGKTEVVDTTTGDALASDILSGKKAWVDGAEITGTLATQTLSSTSVIVTAGNYTGTSLSTVDTDLVASNIACGVNLFGVEGTIGRIQKCVSTTGQTTVFVTGDDGTHQKGCAPIETIATVSKDFTGYNRATLNPCGVGDFTDNSDGTVTDLLTGLIWLKNTNCSVFFNGDNTGSNDRNWANALTAANSLGNGYCGLSDNSTAGNWRLPNINELRSLFNSQLPSPYLPTGHPFTSVNNATDQNYWSSTTYAGNTNNKWKVRLLDGNIYRTGQTATTGMHVWPVKGGQ